MPSYQNIPLVPQNDGTVQIALFPPTNIGGWGLEFRVLPRFGGVSGIIINTCASGYGNGVSGLTVVSSGTGIINSQIWSPESSGLQGAYAWYLNRTNSGSQQTLTEGYMLIAW